MTGELQRMDDSQRAIAAPLFALLQKRKKQIEAIVPNFLTPERVLNLVNTAILRTPSLIECSPHSVVNAIMTATILGLEVAPEQCYLVPYRVKGKMQAQLLIDYRGKRDIVVAGGLVKNIHPYVVFSKDDFSLQMDRETGEMRVNYQPLLYRKGENGERLPITEEAQRGVPLGVLSIAPMTAGGNDVLWMPMVEILAIKARSRAGNDGPWVTDPLEMYKKSAVHRHCKSLPKPKDRALIERITKAQEIDERFEMGEELDKLIEADFEDEAPMIPAGSQDLQDAVAEKKIEELKSSAEPARRKEGKANKSGGEKPPDGPNPDSGAPAGPGVASAPWEDRPFTPAENRQIDAEILKQDEKKAATGGFSPNFRFGRR